MRGGGGGKKFGMFLDAQGKQRILGEYSGILPGYPGGARKV